MFLNKQKYVWKNEKCVMISKTGHYLKNRL